LAKPLGRAALHGIDVVAQRFSDCHSSPTQNPKAARMSDGRRFSRRARRRGVALDRSVSSLFSGAHHAPSQPECLPVDHSGST
jgi:hypothetical protein